MALRSCFAYFRASRHFINVRSQQRNRAFIFSEIETPEFWGVRYFAKKKKKGKKGKASTAASETLASTENEEDDVEDEDAEYDMDKLRSKLDRAYTNFENEMSKLRSGRPDASMFNHIGVDAYGSKQPLPSIGQVVLKSERQVTVNVYDATLKKSVVDALVNAGLDLNPMIEGNAVVVPIPRETKESREKLAKLARQQAEKSKQRVLKMRRDGIARLKTMKSDKSIGEDDFFALQKDVQSHADEYTAKIADTLKAKEGDLLGDSS
eukprot:g1207.t1